MSRLGELLPWNWLKTRVKHQLRAIAGRLLSVHRSFRAQRIRLNRRRWRHRSQRPLKIVPRTPTIAGDGIQPASEA